MVQRADLRLNARQRARRRQWTSGSRALLPDAHKSCTVQAFNAGRFRARSRPAGRLRQPLTLLESSRTNADDRLPRAPLGRVEGGDSFVEGRDVADVRPQPFATHTPNER